MRRERHDPTAHAAEKDAAEDEQSYLLAKEALVSRRLIAQAVPFVNRIHVLEQILGADVRK